jgi:hypothetical protein
MQHRAKNRAWKEESSKTRSKRQGTARVKSKQRARRQNAKKDKRSISAGRGEEERGAEKANRKGRER